MSAPAPRYSSPEEYRNLNRRMVDTILSAEPAPFAEGNYVRRVVDIRGRRSGTLHAVPIAVIMLHGRRFLVSPTRERNWIRNLDADPSCVLRSRDQREACVASPIRDRALAAAVVSTYLGVMNAPWALAQFPFPADATTDQIARKADQVAVFELSPDPNGANGVEPAS